MKCWRCGSHDLRLYIVWMPGAAEEEDIGEDDEDDLLRCAACQLVMSEGEDE